MFIEQAIESYDRDELFGSKLYPVLPVRQVSSGVRRYIIIISTSQALWYDIYMVQDEEIFPEQIPTWGANLDDMATDLYDSEAWQALSIEQLNELNKRDWSDIPHYEDTIALEPGHGIQITSGTVSLVQVPPETVVTLVQVPPETVVTLGREINR